MSVKALSILNNYNDSFSALSSSYCLNAGLPWTNPLKVTVGSEQHITDVTINRGLMMLLNNDYYVDLKTNLLSQQISGIVGNVRCIHDALKQHMQTQSIHEGKGTTINNIYNTTVVSGGTTQTQIQEWGILTEDKIQYLSLNQSAATINQKIASIPKNLNGHNLVFLFVIPTDYSQSTISSNTQYSLDVGNDTILFQNFMNGTIFIFGDYLHSTTYFDQFGNEKINFNVQSIQKIKKTPNQIKNPTRYDGINLQRYVQKLYRQIDNPQNIDDIIQYNNKNSLKTNKLNLKKIVIKGSALNSNYSIMSLNNVKATVYVKNLTFKSTLQADKNNIIDLQQFARSMMPTSNKFLLEWPLNNTLYPTIGQSFSNQILNQSYQDLYNRYMKYQNLILNGYNQLSSILLKDNYTVIQNLYSWYKLHQEIDNTVSKQLLSSQLDQQLLKQYTGQKSRTQLYPSMQNTLSNFSISASMLKTQLDYSKISSMVEGSQYINQNTVNSLKNQFFTAFQLGDSMIKNRITTQLSAYQQMTGTGLFDSATFLNDLNVFMNYVESFIQQLSACFQNSTFGLYFSYRPDLIGLPQGSITLNAQDAKNKFIQKYKSGTLVSTLNLTKEIVLNQLIALFANAQTVDFSEDLKFRYSEGQIGLYENVKSAFGSPDNKIRTNNSDGSVDCISLSSTMKTYPRISENSNYSKYVGKFLFSPKKWQNVSQRGIQNSLPMFDSKYDSTITFWTKMKDKYQLSKTTFLSFSNGISQKQFKFSLKPTQYTSYNTLTNSSPLKCSDIFDGDKQRCWVLWSIKIDNSTKEKCKEWLNAPISGRPHYDDQLSGIICNLQNSMAVKVTAYQYSNSSESLVKYQMNTDDFDSRSPYLSGLNALKNLSGSFIQYPFSNGNFDNFSVNLGYSNQPNDPVNGDGANEYKIDGRFRNLMFFKGHLTSSQQEALWTYGILPETKFPSQYQNQTMKKLINSGIFFLGLVSIYDSTNINIINCDTKYSGNTYKIE